MRRPLGTSSDAPQACITNGSLTAMQATSMPRSRKRAKFSTKPGRCRSEQVGVKAPGTANSTTLLSSNSVGVSTACTPSSMYLSTTSGMRSPIWMVMGNLPGRMNGRLSSHGEPLRGLESNLRAPILPAWRPGAAADTRSPEMSIVRYRQRPSEVALHDEIKQVFDRFFGEQDTDASAVVTAQWVPRVDIKEESGRFVIYADLPGIDP